MNFACLNTASCVWASLIKQEIIREEDSKKAGVEWQEMDSAHLLNDVQAEKRKPNPNCQDGELIDKQTRTDSIIHMKN